MPAPLSGPGAGLNIAQNLYPSQIFNSGYDFGSNQVALNSGDEIPVPSGVWYIGLGFYLTLEYLDPVLGVWISTACGTWQTGPIYVKSDGFNFRVANRTACPVGGIVLTGGSSYVQATTTISVTGGGGSTWVPIVGGALVSASVTGGFGAGYGVPPIVIIPAPPPPQSNPNGVGGRPATGYATISGGSVTSVVLTDQGCGYPAGFTITLLPNPTDPNINVGITNALWSFTTGFAGSITGIVCTNPGNAISTPQNLSLTVGGAGTNASVAPVMLATLTAASVQTTGSGFGNVSVVGATMVGGFYPRGSISLSREFLNIFARPRPAQVSLATTGTGSLSIGTVGTIVDGGLYFLQGNAVTPNVYPGFIEGASTTSIVNPGLATTMGGTQDVVTMQPAP